MTTAKAPIISPSLQKRRRMTPRDVTHVAPEFSDNEARLHLP